VAGSIICGIDNSESAAGAVQVARRLSAQLNLRLVFVRVVEDGTAESELGAVSARLNELAELVAVDGGANWLVEAGHPADRLVAVAKKEAASLIVVGSTGPRSSLLGSISADVSRRAPVVVVPPGAHQIPANGNGRVTGLSGSSGHFDYGHTDVRDLAGGIVRFGLGSRVKGS
jgi:nucleotide-binding universal stress UspA family protein